MVKVFLRWITIFYEIWVKILIKIQSQWGMLEQAWEWSGLTLKFQDRFGEN
jgi:hypothetical protein